MKRYVEQLLDDIEVAQNKAYETIDRWVDSNGTSGSEDYFDPQPDDGIVLSELFGLEQCFLPPDNYLDDEELREVTTAIIQLWRAHGLYPIFTPNLPKRLKYKLLCNNWNQMVFPSPGEKVDVELCDYQTCPFCDECPVCEHKNDPIKK
ncbi:MAG: hypothetical protein QM786_13180 [Breznakibacter sp.]